MQSTSFSHLDATVGSANVRALHFRAQVSCLNDLRKAILAEIRGCVALLGVSTRDRVSLCAMSAQEEEAHTDVTPEQLADVLRPFIRSKGASFIEYDEATEIKNTKLCAKAIEKFGSLAVALVSFNSAMYLPKLVTQQAMAALAKDFGPKLRMTDDESKDWQSCICLRLRNMMSSLAGVQRRQSHPKWYKNLPWPAPEGDTAASAQGGAAASAQGDALASSQASAHTAQGGALVSSQGGNPEVGAMVSRQGEVAVVSAPGGGAQGSNQVAAPVPSVGGEGVDADSRRQADGDGDDEADKNDEDDEETAAARKNDHAISPSQAAGKKIKGKQPVYFYGLQKDLRVAFRCRPGEPMANAELSVDVQEGATSESPVIAVFGDGSTWDTGMLTCRWKLLTGGKKNAERLWVGTCVHTNHELYVRQRVDREPDPLLLSLFEQGKQIASVSVKLWGLLPFPIGQLDPMHPLIVSSLAFFKPYAERYMNGEFDTHALLKKKILADLVDAGFQPAGTRGAKKRPAAAEPQEEASEPQGEEEAVVPQVAAPSELPPAKRAKVLSASVAASSSARVVGPSEVPRTKQAREACDSTPTKMLLASGKKCAPLCGSGFAGRSVRVHRRRR